MSGCCWVTRGRCKFIQYFGLTLSNYSWFIGFMSVMKKPSLLIVDSDPVTLNLLRKIAGSIRSLEVIGVREGLQALSLIASRPTFDLVITEMKLLDVDGYAILKAAKDKSLNTLVAMVSGLGNHEKTVMAIKQGLSGYVTKPFREEEIELLLHNMTEKLFLVNQVHELSDGLGKSQRRLADLKAEVSRLEAKITEWEEQGLLEPEGTKGDIGTAIDQAARKKVSTITHYDLYNSLSELSKLREEKVISDEEFQKFRKAALDKVYNTMAGVL